MFTQPYHLQKPKIIDSYPSQMRYVTQSEIYYIVKLKLRNVYLKNYEEQLIMSSKQTAHK